MKDVNCSLPGQFFFRKMAILNRRNRTAQLILPAAVSRFFRPLPAAVLKLFSRRNFQSSGDTAVLIRHFISDIYVGIPASVGPEILREQNERLQVCRIRYIHPSIGHSDGIAKLQICLRDRIPDFCLLCRFVRIYS